MALPPLEQSSIDISIQSDSSDVLDRFRFLFFFWELYAVVVCVGSPFFFDIL
ncbi:hypothetical protein M422DRAFT_274178 [Sphaerobolus stellatus SS14]|uniref:Autophagy-related protein n=1 Tax=Sphaerobolus stellatus (strain SS14) TaxID=990650 RepID=A0A0C9UIC7_SPHS4|nr:hypothetical protein M422DRAFT_274178 [Sphaerobolus stellatus SS14]